jgi:hypothetical protein
VVDETLSRYVVRVFLPWEETETVAIVGPFNGGDEIAEALEQSGRQRSDASEDPLTAFWGRGIEVLPISREMPPG